MPAASRTWASAVAPTSSRMCCWSAWRPATGPRGGRILRPSDGKEPRTVAFVQCAGSRDENHLPYCSAVCCTASMKHAAYIRALNPETAITIFYIDIRTPGRLEEFSARVDREASLRLVKGKVARWMKTPAPATCW